MMSVLRRFTARGDCRNEWGKLLGIVLAKILGLFQAGKASPLDVDSMNQSLMHHFAWAAMFIMTVRIERPNEKTEVQRDANSVTTGAEGFRPGSPFRSA